MEGEYMKTVHPACEEMIETQPVGQPHLCVVKECLNSQVAGKRKLCPACAADQGKCEICAKSITDKPRVRLPVLATC